MSHSHLLRFLAAAFLVAAGTEAASACSADFDPETYARQIEDRTDVRRLEGRFLVDRVERRDEGTDAYVHGVIYGHVIGGDGRTYPTVQTFTEPQISCLSYTKPTLDAEGTFYITRSASDGRFEMLLWAGRYLGEDSEFVIPPLDSAEAN
ncbi:MAG TPA: hypothetical protein VI168_06975 [Croceibacterium sp.]